MKTWWVQPLVRIMVALLLPLLVPACITALIWALPGDPAEIICPPSICTGGEELAKRWHLNDGPVNFYTHWLSGAVGGDFGNSWRVLTGEQVSTLMLQTIPNTLLLICLSLIPISLGAFLGSLGKPSRKWDPLLSLLGVLPVVVLALLAFAVVEVNCNNEINTLVSLGGDDPWFSMLLFVNEEFLAQWGRMIAGACTLGIADGALSGSITGFRGLFLRENQQRYVGVSVLRGENTLSNTLPNLAGTLAGQYRARIIHLLSGSVIVEVIVGIDGFGALLWRGTLLQDFGVVLASATVFALLSSLLLLSQALLEVSQMLHIRRAPNMEAA